MDSDSSPKLDRLGKNDFGEVLNCSDNNGNDEKDDYRGREAADSKIIESKNQEEYKDNASGIKIEYNLTANDVRRFIRHGKPYKSQRKTRLKYVVLQSLIFLLLFILSIVSHSIYLVFVSFIPIAALLTLAITSYMEMKTNTEILLKEKRFMIDIFPDRLEVSNDSQKVLLNLDGSCESDEYKDLIIVSKPDKTYLIIPLRAVEPDLRADVQAMIAAGCKPA